MVEATNTKNTNNARTVDEVLWLDHRAEQTATNNSSLSCELQKDKKQEHRRSRGRIEEACVYGAETGRQQRRRRRSTQITSSSWTSSSSPVSSTVTSGTTQR